MASRGGRPNKTSELWKFPRYSLRSFETNPAGFLIFSDFLMDVCRIRPPFQNSNTIKIVILNCSFLDPDPHWFGCPGFGSVLGMGIQIQEHGYWPKLTNKPGLLPFKKAFVPSYYLLSVHFSCILADQDPDSHWLGSLDPDPHWNQSGSTTLLFCALFPGDSKFRILSKKNFEESQ